MRDSNHYSSVPSLFDSQKPALHSSIMEVNVALSPVLGMTAVPEPSPLKTKSKLFRAPGEHQKPT